MSKDSELKYLQMPLPSGQKYYKLTKRTWHGLNMRQTIDTGELSKECNISTEEAPYLTPAELEECIFEGYENPIGIFGFDNFLLVIYRSGKKIIVDYITFSDDGEVLNTYAGTLKASGEKDDDETCARCVVQFNVYDTPTDPLTGNYIKKLLVFPDKKSMDFDIAQDDFEISDMEACVKEYYNDTEEEDGTYPPPSTASKSCYYKNTYNQDVYRWVDDDTGENSGWKVSVPPAVPDIKYATVHLSRLFGVDDIRVFASGYNDYTNWNLDTVDDYSESNAWVSPAQSNTEAGGNFTGITSFNGHIVCFKNDFMHEIYNTKNPFRIQDVFAEGAIDNRTIRDVSGRLIFVSEDGVKIYTGSNPKNISDKLNFGNFFGAVSGTDGKNYYLYAENERGTGRFFVYDTELGEWAERAAEGKILGFAQNKSGMFMLKDDGGVYKLNSKNFNRNWSFETDLMTSGSVDIKRLKKLQMFADVESGAYFKVYVLYDDEIFDENTSHLVYESEGFGQKTVRVKPRMTAHYGIKLHVEGFGYVKLYELELFTEKGGDLYV